MIRFELHKDHTILVKQEKIEQITDMNHSSEILLYQTANGEIKIDVRLEDETVWLNQKQMADLFQTTVPNINMHLKNIFEEGELEPISTIKNSLIVRLEGNRQVNRNIDFYNPMLNVGC